MDQYIITFRSVTWAQRGQRLLEGKRLRCSLRRTPRWMEERGCGYSLAVTTDQPSGVVALLRQAGLPLGRVYRSSGGELREVAL